MYHSIQTHHSEKDMKVKEICEKDILAPRIPENLKTGDLSVDAISDDAVISMTGFEGALIEDLSVLSICGF